MGYPLPAVAASACIVVVVVAVNVLGERLMDTAER
jgi:ABC-type dipeptide/oligopeptide/nickel transport system permease subunit